MTLYNDFPKDPCKIAVKDYMNQKKINSQILLYTSPEGETKIEAIHQRIVKNPVVPDAASRAGSKRSGSI